MVAFIPFHPENYVRLFRVKGLRYLIDDTWMGFYRKLNLLVVVVDDEFTSYMPREILARTLEEGVALFSDPQAFAEYERSFLEFMQHTKAFCEELKKKGQPSQNYCQRFFELLPLFFSYYSKTEFFYTDKAFALSQGNAVLTSNLRRQGEIKFAGRTLLNEIYFGKDSYLAFVLGKISELFSVSQQELEDYSIEEILALFEGKRPDLTVLHERGIAFYMVGIGERIIIKVGTEAENAVNNFQRTENTSEVCGIVANHGKIRGTVAKIVSGYDNYDNLQRLIATMPKGSILVSETTSPELTLACEKASAIVTDQGGLLSHAAIVSRELGIPCIVGTEIATKVFQDGDLVEVDAERGVVRKIDK